MSTSVPMTDVTAAWAELLACKAEPGLVVLESSLAVRAETRDGRRRGLLTEHLTGLRVEFHLGAVRHQWSAAPGEEQALADRMAAVIGSAALKAPAPVPTRMPDDLGDRLGRLIAEPSAWEPEPPAPQASFNVLEDVHIRDITITDRTGDTTVARQAGVRQRCAAAVTVKGVTALGNSRAYRWGLDAAPRPPGSLVDTALAQALRLASARSIGRQRTPVVFAPGVGAALLHELIGHSLEGDNFTGAHAGRLCIGQSVSSTAVTVVDDPGMIHGCGSRQRDDEGVVTAPTTLVDGGTIAGVLHSTATGASTGSARRADYRRPALPRTSNTVVCAGPDDPDELLTGPGQILHVLTLGSGGVIPARGSFSFAAPEAVLIGPRGSRTVLRDVTLFGDAAAVLSSLCGVAADTATDAVTCTKAGQPLGIGLSSPTLRFGTMDWTC